MNKFRGHDVFHGPAVYTRSVTWPKRFRERFTSVAFLPDALGDLSPDQRTVISDEESDGGFVVIARRYCLARRRVLPREKVDGVKSRRIVRTM